MNGGDLENLEVLEVKEEIKEEFKEGKEDFNYSEKMIVKKEDVEKYGKISFNEWLFLFFIEEYKVVY